MRGDHDRTREDAPNSAGAAAGGEHAAQAEWKAPPRWLPRALHSLAYRNFFLLWLGQVANSLALWMDLVARPVLVIAMTGSPVHLGFVTLARGAPMLVLAPFGGVLADRVDRRVLMLVGKHLTLVLYIGVAALVLTDNLQLWHLYATALIKSVLNIFDHPARHALLPAMVPPRLLMNAVAINSGTMQTSRIFSGSMAGLLIAGWAAAFGFGERDVQAFGGVYIAIALSQIIAVAAIYVLRVPLAARPRRTNDSWGASFLQGIRYAWRSPVILGVLTLFALKSTFGMPYLQVFVPWLAIEVMGIGARGAGLLMATSAAGSLLGAVVMATWGPALRRRGLLVIAGMAVFGLGLVALGLTATLPPTLTLGIGLPLLPAAIIVGTGLANSTVQTLKNALLLEATPNELRGRIMSLHQMDRGLSTAGSGTAGFAIAAIGGPYALAVFGGLCAAGAAGALLLAPGLRKVN